jgi:protoheme IX farnesyltransferase
MSLTSSPALSTNPSPDELDAPARVPGVAGLGRTALVRGGSPGSLGSSLHGLADHAPLPLGVVSVMMELAKPRITRLVVLTAVVGFLLALKGLGAQTWTLGSLAIVVVGCALGTALSAGGANTLNMWWEAERDARMHRTLRRPLPTGRVSSRAALGSGIGLAAAGVGVLWATCGPIAAGLSLLTVLIYVLAYTPLKPVTILNTLVGAVPGAMPPLIGWAAASTLATQPSAYSGLEHPGAWSLFALMFVWQVPHVCALAWMHRDDYERGGYRMLPIIDATGRLTAWTVLISGVALLGAMLLPAWAMPERLGFAYSTIAALSGLAFLALCARLVARPERGRARTVFFGSIIHLPLLLAAIVVEVGVRLIWA